MARKKTTLAELRVGLLVLVTIVILIIFVLSVTGDNAIFRHQVTIKTRFAAAEGLKPGDEVRLAGKRVGKVESIDFAEIPTSPQEKAIIVTMVLDSNEIKNRIREDSTAVLGQQGFLGDRIIDISPGTAKSAVLKTGAEITSADQATLAQVFGGANDLLVTFNYLGKQLQELMDDINKGHGTMGKFMHDDSMYVNLNKAVIEAQQLVKSAREGNGTLAKLINDPTMYDDIRKATNQLTAIAQDLNDGKGTVGKMLKDDEMYKKASDTIDKLDTTAGKLEKISSDIEAGKGTVGKLLKDDKIHSDIQATISSIKSISADLEKGQGTAGKLLKDEQLYNNLNQMSSETVKLLYEFRQNPKKFLNIKVSLF